MPDAPAAPPPVAPSPAPAPAAPSAPGRFDAASALGKYADVSPTRSVATTSASPTDHRAPKKPAEPVKAQDAPAAPKPVGDAPKPADKPAEPAKPAPATEPAKPGDKPATEPAPTELPDETQIANSPKALRQAYKQAKNLVKELSAKFKDMANAPKQDDPKVTQLRERLQELEKKNSEYEDKLRFENFTKSEEFKSKYEEPYFEAFQSGREIMSQMKVVDKDTGAWKQFAAEDFDRLMAIQDHGEFSDALENMGLSGARAQVVIEARSQVRGILAKADKAKAEYQKNGQKIETERREKFESEHKSMREGIQQVWQKSLAEPQQKFPEIYKPVEGDTEGNQLLEEGFSFAAEAFKTMDPFKPNLTTEQRHKAVQMHAEVFNKAATWNKLAHLLHKARTSEKAMAAKLKAYEDSQPGPGDVSRNGGAAAPEANDLDSRLGKYADKSR